MSAGGAVSHPNRLQRRVPAQQLSSRQQQMTVRVPVLHISGSLFILCVVKLFVRRTHNPRFGWQQLRSRYFMVRLWREQQLLSGTERLGKYQHRDYINNLFSNCKMTWQWTVIMLWGNNSSWYKLWPPVNQHNPDKKVNAPHHECFHQVDVLPVWLEEFQSVRFKCW